MKIRNFALKVSIFFTSIFATVAAVLGFRLQQEMHKNDNAKDDAHTYTDDLMSSDIVKAQRAFAKERDITLQEAAHTASIEVTQQTTTTTVEPQKVVEPVSAPAPKPKSSKKTKTS